ncbi:MAG: response regulator [Thermodesulfovibrionales bacterium]|jgi:CheY-like chemotaxis protein
MSDAGEKKKILIQKEVTINNILKAVALDISEEGMFVTVHAEFLAGAFLDISFHIDDTPLQVKAVVQRSDPGIGISVKFIDLAPKDFALIQKLVERGSVTAPAEKAEKKILLVDDSTQSRSIYKNKLNLEGFSVVEASNGVEALKCLREMKPDIVILDLWMEGIDGFKILQLMSMNPELKRIPVIVLSARVIPADIEKVISLGAKDFLPKMTTSPVKLAQKVKEVLSRK